MNKRALVGVIGSVISTSGLVIGLLALANVIPLKYVWGGRITDRSQIVPMEIVTLFINIFIIWAIGMRAGYFSSKIKQSSLRYTMLILAILMALNTMGNLAAKTNVEKLLALPTAISTFCFLYLYRYGAAESQK